MSDDLRLPIEVVLLPNKDNIRKRDEFMRDCSDVEIQINDTDGDLIRRKIMENNSKMQLENILKKQIKSLKMVALNLQIESKRIHEPNAIDVIATRIQEMTDKMEDELNQIIKEEK